MNGLRTPETDAELIRRIQRGEADGYALLMERYQKLVYTIAYRMIGRHEDAQDITQECFLRAYAALPRFRADQPFAPWISRIVSNLCLNWLEKSKRERLTEEGTLEDFPARTSPPGETGELQTALQQAILKLPPRHRLVFTLRYLEGHDCREVARITELPEGTVKTYLFRARQQLRKELRRFWHEE